MLTEMHSGTFFNLDHPVAEQVHLSDIAHHLSNICRFGGGTNTFYSVAEHCIQVSAYLEGKSVPLVRLAALLHDAHEAYVGDVTTPVKFMLGKKYRDLVCSLDMAIAWKFNMSYDDLHSPQVWEADQALLTVESYYMMPSAGESYGRHVDPEILKLLRPMRLLPEDAKDLFMHTYNRLNAEMLADGGTPTYAL